MKQRISDCFDKSAHTYDSYAHLQVDIAQRLFDRIKLYEPRSILEIGCGTGLLTQLLATTFPSSQILASDIAPGMLDHCQKRLSTYPDISYACFDGESLKLHATFDLITSSMTFHWFSQLKDSLEQLTHLLSKQGKLLFSLLGENSLMEWKNLLNNNHYPIPTPKFPSLPMLTNEFPYMNFEVEIIKKTYASLYEFLTSLKKIGAYATRRNSYLSPTQLRKLISEQSSPIEITYEVIYGSYQK